MSRQAAFLVLLVASSLYAIARGGRPEQIGAVTLLVGAIASLWVVHPRGARFYHLETGILMTDMAILGVFLWLSIQSSRFWPIWITAFVAAEVIIHLAFLIAPKVNWLAYMDATALWSWAAQTILILATWRHRQRVKTLGVDASWKT